MPHGVGVSAVGVGVFVGVGVVEAGFLSKAPVDPEWDERE